MNLRRIAATAAALAALAALGACSSDEGTDSTHDGHGTTASAPSSASAHGQDGSTAQDGTEHNDADVMFAQMMLPHHQQAIVMSDILLDKDGVPDDVRALATGIKDAQGPEIRTMTEWLGRWGAPTAHDMPAHEMEGMVSPEGLAKLKNAPGPEASRLYLEQMIGHHEGAVQMAEDEVENGANADAVALARSIIDSQQKEIDQMKEMLQD